VKKTNEKIVDTALQLFNSYGLSKVTLRTIAKELGISQGNLNYHYKKRDDIIEALYFQLVKNIDESIAQNKLEEVGLQLLFNSSTAIMNNFYEYRFFLLDFVQIMRENKTIKKHYLKLVETRKEQFIGLFKLLTKYGIMRKEVLPNEYVFLYNRFQILGDFWISSAEVVNAGVTKKVILEYTEIINQSIYPYLTVKGREAYQSLVYR